MQPVPKTVVIGATGLIGKALFPSYRRMYPATIGTGRSGAPPVTSFDLAEPDIKPLELVESGHQHALILAAQSNVAECEQDPEGTRAINVTGTLKLVDQLLEAGIFPIFASSDYVFDGQTGNYREEDPTSPTTEYGRQKVEVEQAVLEKSGGQALILRLGKIYSLEQGDGSLFDEMGAALAAGETLRAATDQLMRPLLRDDLADTICRLQQHEAKGVVHVCGDETWSRYELAVRLAELMELSAEVVTPISLDDLGGIPRPKNTTLNNGRMRGHYRRHLTKIETSLARIARFYSRD